MKYSITTIIILLVIVFGGYYFFTQTSKVPEGIPRADVVDLSDDSEVGASSDSTDENATDSDTVSSISDDGSILGSPYKVNDLTFSFVGYGPAGKTETGTFTRIVASDIELDNLGNPISGTLTIDAKSVSTGIERLDTHLCADDFFDCQKNPNIVFKLKKAVFSENTPDVTVTGDLTLNGITKEITFKVSQNKFTVVADFLLDTTPFNLKYAGVNKEVRIKFGFNVVKK
jgi:hypothetical protein